MEDRANMVILFKQFKIPFRQNFQLMTQLVFRPFIYKGGYLIGPGKTEVPTYLQSYASTLVTDID